MYFEFPVASQVLYFDLVDSRAPSHSADPDPLRNFRHALERGPIRRALWTILHMPLNFSILVLVFSYYTLYI